jgi:hypothetical protein
MKNRNNPYAGMHSAGGGGAMARSPSEQGSVSGPSSVSGRSSVSGKSLGSDLSGQSKRSVVRKSAYGSSMDKWGGLLGDEEERQGRN